MLPIIVANNLTGCGIIQLLVQPHFPVSHRAHGGSSYTQRDQGEKVFTRLSHFVKKKKKKKNDIQKNSLRQEILNCVIKIVN